MSYRVSIRLSSPMPAKQKKEVRFHIPEESRPRVMSTKAPTPLPKESKKVLEPTLKESKKPSPPKRSSHQSSKEGRYHYEETKRTEVLRGVKTTTTTSKFRYWR